MENIFNEDQATLALREKNLKTVEEYFSYRGLNRGAHRLKLWVDDDCLFELTFTRDCKPMQFIGRAALEKKESSSNVAMFPDWGFEVKDIHQTDDPNYLIAECIGKGVLLQDGAEPSYYQNHYLIDFEMRDGKIKTLREVHNPCCLMLAFRQPLPQFPWYR